MVVKDGIIPGMLLRAKAIKNRGSLEGAVKSGDLKQFEDISLSEALILGLLNQKVTKYVGILGHGTTDIGEVLRIYEDAGLVKLFNVRHETEAAHIVTALKWQYNEVSAVITSIGPGAMHALAGSLVSASNGLGVYHIYGSETTHNEGPNMQQIPKHEQELFLKLTSVMGKSYVLHTPESIFAALRRGYATVYNPDFASPFYFLMPINTQPMIVKNCNLMELPRPEKINSVVCNNEENFKEAVNIIKNSKKITIKIGGGSSKVGQEIQELAYLIDAVIVTGPNVSGVVPYKHERNMTVGGSKGTPCGNYAMNEADLLILIGARGVCQWDCSGTAWGNAKWIINFNTDIYDATHYNNTIPLIGDAKSNLTELIKYLKNNNLNKSKKISSEWLNKNIENKKEWEIFKQKIFKNSTIFDPVWGKKVLTQPAAIKIVCDFTYEKNAIKYFDSGDVQANGFQLVEDSRYGQTFTDTGSSYMGFASSALLANAIVGKGVYGVAFVGDGSFTMNPQILIDAVQHKLNAMIVIFDNRSMAAISGLQIAQYGKSFKTNDNVIVDYASWANSIKGVKGIFGGWSSNELMNALSMGFDFPGLSVIHIPVYRGSDEFGGLGVYGKWNVGNWCKAVQEEHHLIGL